jgi:hypothetical protein
MKQVISSIVRVFALTMLTACVQPVDTRTYVPFDATPIFTLPNNTLDVYAQRPRLTDFGLVVIDKVQKNIKIIDPKTSQVVLNFGRGGKGPGEYQQIWHIADHDSLLFVLDTSLHRLTIVSGMNGEVIRTIPVRKDPLRIESNGQYYAMNSIGTDSLIYLFDLESDSLLSKANVENLDIQSKYALSMQGFFTFRNDKINYFPVYDGRIFEYTVSDGAFVNYRIVETPDTSRFKPTVALSETGTFIAKAPPLDYARMGAAYDNGKYYSLSRYYDMKKRELVYAVIDVFDESLAYSYSFDIAMIKPMPQEMTVKNGIVCFMDLEILNCYKLP